jgi:hypothetical protein
VRMASPHAAKRSIHYPPKDRFQTVLAAGLLTLVAGSMLLLLAAATNSTLSAFSARPGAILPGETAAPEPDSRPQQRVDRLRARRGSAPVHSPQLAIINDPWPSAEHRDPRQDLLDMASAQRGHWRPKVTSTRRSTTDSDDRIANALFDSEARGRASQGVPCPTVHQGPNPLPDG